MIDTKQTNLAVQLAYQAHRGQTDKAGLPYICHPLHVAEHMPDELSTIVAVLHDVLEDTPMTAESLLQAGIPARAVNSICHLTRKPEVPYLEYIRNLRSDPIAVRVKLADLAHNSDLSRLSTVTQADLARREKYQTAIQILKTTEVVAALIWQDKRFLICQRPKNKARGLLWEFVGGKVEAGETKPQALIRECQEELAVTLSVGDVFTEVTHFYPDLTVHLTLFDAAIASGTPQMLEHHDMRWITPAEIHSFEFCPADIEILQKIKNRV